MSHQMTLLLLPPQLWRHVSKPVPTVAHVNKRSGATQLPRSVSWDRRLPLETLKSLGTLMRLLFLWSNLSLPLNDIVWSWTPSYPNRPYPNSCFNTKEIMGNEFFKLEYCDPITYGTPTYIYHCSKVSSHELTLLWPFGLMGNCQSSGCRISILTASYRHIDHLPLVIVLICLFLLTFFVLHLQLRILL